MLYAPDVVVMEFEVGIVALVVRRHKRLGDVRVGQSKGMTELMSSHDLQVCAFFGVQRPLLIVVKVSVTGNGTGAGKERMCQSSTLGGNRKDDSFYIDLHSNRLRGKPVTVAVKKLEMY